MKGKQDRRRNMFEYNITSHTRQTPDPLNYKVDEVYEWLSASCEVTSLKFNVIFLAIYQIFSICQCKYWMKNSKIIVVVSYLFMWAMMMFCSIFMTIGELLFGLFFHQEPSKMKKSTSSATKLGSCLLFVFVPAFHPPHLAWWQAAT